MGCYDTFIIWNNSCDWINWFSELNSKSRSVRFSCDLIHWKDPTQKIHSQISHLNTRRHMARFSVNNALKLVNELIVTTTTCIALVEQSSEKKEKKGKSNNSQTDQFILAVHVTKFNQIFAKEHGLKKCICKIKDFTIKCRSYLGHELNRT